MIRLRGPLLVLACATVLAGCQNGTTQHPSSPEPSSQVSIPADATTLVDRGLVHGPSELLLPKGLSIASRIDQPNVVTLTLPTTESDVLQRWFTTRLPDGWSVDASRDASILFHSPDQDGIRWEGATTCSEQVCALTLRHQRR